MSARLLRCPQGHVFDGGQGSQCPQCGAAVEAAAAGATSSPAASKPSPAEGPAWPLPLPVLAVIGAVIFAGLLAVAWPRTPSKPDLDKGKQQAVAERNNEGGGASSRTPTKPGQRQESLPPIKNDPAGADKEKTVSATAAVIPPPQPPRPGPIENPSATEPAAIAVPDLRNAMVLTMEEKHGFSPLARELLATTRGCYAYGRKEHAMAASWLTSDAARNNPASSYYLGLMQEEGVVGGGKDYGSALIRINRAAQKSFYFAEKRLGEIYLRGSYPNMSADRAKAKAWLIRAAKDERDDLRPLLAEAGISGADVGPTLRTLDTSLKQSFQDAYQTAQMLRAQGSSASIFWLAMFTFNGHGTKADTAAARELITDAARLYVASALKVLAQWAAEGDGVRKNGVEAAALAYLAYENIVYEEERKSVEKVVLDYVSPLTPEEYSDLGILLAGVHQLPGRQPRAK